MFSCWNIDIHEWKINKGNGAGIGPTPLGDLKGVQFLFQPC